MCRQSCPSQDSTWGYGISMWHSLWLTFCTKRNPSNIFCFLMLCQLCLEMCHIYYFCQNYCNTARKLNYMKMWRMSRKWKTDESIFWPKKKKGHYKYCRTAGERVFLTCNVLPLKRFVALQIVVPLETNQFKKPCKDLTSLLKLKYFHFNLL